MKRIALALLALIAFAPLPALAEDPTVTARIDEWGILHGKINWHLPNGITYGFGAMDTSGDWFGEDCVTGKPASCVKRGTGVDELGDIETLTFGIGYDRDLGDNWNVHAEADFTLGNLENGVRKIDPQGGAMVTVTKGSFLVFLAYHDLVTASVQETLLDVDGLRLGVGWRF